MSIKKTIYKIALFSLAAVALSGLTVLLVAANNKNDSGVCNGTSVKIKSAGEDHYVHEEDVMRVIQNSTHGSPVNKPVSGIDLSQLEKDLEANPWIEDAELYFDSKSYLNVLIKEREPLARVFTTMGSSFYIDAKSYQMPVPDKAIRVQVITGFTAVKNWNAKDSSVMNEAKQIVKFVSHDAFWNAQIGGINITSNGFELVPIIGDHIIRVGSAENIDQKLHRAFVFYKQVLSKEGFNKYAAINVQFDGEVVAVKKEPTSKVDALQLQKNIDELLLRKKQEQENEAALEKKQAEQNIIKTNQNTVETKTLTNNSVPVKTFSHPSKIILVKKNTTQPKSVKKQKEEMKNVQKPKAAMKKKETPANEY